MAANPIHIADPTLPLPLPVDRSAALVPRAAPRVAHHVTSATPAFVLTMAGYYGTIAAARCLGARGVPVIVADSERLLPARWSRSVSRSERCPPARPLERFIGWLLELGAREPGHVLYATCDDLAWAFAEHQAELARYFRIWSPPFAAVARVLDKRTLYEACAAVSIRTPRTWFPHDDGELAAIARDARFPLIVKPRTQVRFKTMRKGMVVSSADDLREAYRSFVRGNPYDPVLLARHADVERPMVQEFCQGIGEPIYSVSGYCDARHEFFLARGTNKLVQWPRRAGIGICFEDTAVDEVLASKVRRLCKETGIFGIFEAEFAMHSGEPLLIDFNPRFFGQMGFDVARGLPSPYLVYLEAMGAFLPLRAEVAAAQAWRPSGPVCFMNGTALAWTSMVERLVGRTPVWPGCLSRTSQPRRLIDAVRDRDDWVPGVVDGVQQIVGALRHPRATLRAASRGE